MESRTVTTTIDAETYRYLIKLLADNSASTESELVAEAVRVFIEDQSWRIEAIKEGIRRVGRRGQWGHILN